MGDASMYASSFVSTHPSSLGVPGTRGKKGKPKSTLQRLSKGLYIIIVRTQVGFAIDVFQTLLSFVACAVYVAGTYVSQHPTPDVLIWFEYFFGVAFTVDYLLHLFIAENRMVYVISWGALVDLLAILPVFAVNSDASIGFLRVFRVFRVLRILRGYRMFTAGGGNNDEAGVSRQIAVLMFFVVSFVFVASGFAHSLEMIRPGSFIRPFTSECQWERYRNDLDTEIPGDCQLSFFTTVYLVLLTATTLGLGDIYPSDDLARAMTLGILLPLFYILPREVSKLTELLNKQSKFGKRFTGSVTGHVVVCGSHIQRATAQGFLTEFYHADHGEQKLKVVLLCPEEPSLELEALLLEPQFDNKVQYIRGSALVSAQFSKARPYDAAAVFVLTSQFEDDALSTDAVSVLTVKAVSSTVPWVPVYCQLVNPMSKVHASWAEWNYLVCIDELKMNILAKSCLCPGFSTLIANLITSSSDYDVASLGSLDKEWVEEYLDGYGQEVYLVPLSKSFVGKLFCVAANICFNEFRVCLFGVETRQFGTKGVRPAGSRRSRDGEDSDTDSSPSDDEGASMRVRRGKHSRTRILVNPKDYLIRTGDRAFVIADDKRSALALSTWSDFYARTRKDILSITPADKRTFTRLNDGHGRLLKGAQSRISSTSAHTDLFEAPATPGPSGAGVGAGASGVWRAGEEDLAGLAGPGTTPRPSSAHGHSPLPPPLPLRTPSPGMDRWNGTPGSALEAKDGTGMLYPRVRVSDIPQEVTKLYNATFLRGHIIVCGAPSGLPHFIAPLRKSTSVPIVILDPTEVELPASPSLHNVYYVPGSSLNVDDLVRAGVKTASMTVVLTTASRTGLVDAPLQTGSVGRDIDAVFTVCVIEATYHCRTLVELAEHESMKFLPHRPQDDKVPAAMWPQFCGGYVYTSSTLDTLLCQAFYNKSLLRVLSHIITPYSLSPEPPAPTAGPGAKSMPTPHVYVENRHVVQMRVPKPYVDREYRALWMELVLTRGELPIALYRCREAKNAPLSYVIANPRPSTRLHAYDRVFVLCGESLLAEAARATASSTHGHSRPRAAPGASHMSPRAGAAAGGGAGTGAGHGGGAANPLAAAAQGATPKSGVHGDMQPSSAMAGAQARGGRGGSHARSVA